MNTFTVTDKQQTIEITARHPWDYYAKHAPAASHGQNNRQSQEYAARMARTIEFMDKYGVVKANPRPEEPWCLADAGVPHVIDAKWPYFDHTQIWRRPGKHRPCMVTTEPYNHEHLPDGIHDMGHGFTVEARPEGEGMWNPPSCRLLIWTWTKPLR